jgi:hypothetical protein
VICAIFFSIRKVVKWCFLIYIEFWIEEHCLKDLVDWFGWEKFKIWSQKNKRLLIRVKCSETAMQFWALSYGEYVEITKPQRLRDKIREVAQGIGVFQK